MTDRTFRTEFPDFDPATMPAIPETWIDQSWHNETCPRFHTPNGLVVFVDFADDGDREFGGGTRFSVHIDGDDLEVLHEGDDWDAVLAFVASKTTNLPARLIPRVNTLAEGMNWIDALVEEGLMFHFEDTPSTIIIGSTDAPLFDEWGATIVGARIAQLYDLKWPEPCGCPIGYALCVPGEWADDEERLVEEFKTFATAHGFAKGDAAELLIRDDLTDFQRRWLSNFSKRWDAVFPGVGA